MFQRPQRFSDFDSAHCFFSKAVVACVSNLAQPCHFEAFLCNPDFEKFFVGPCSKPDASGARVINVSQHYGYTSWFDTLSIEHALKELDTDPALRLSVNISPGSAATPAFVDNLKTLLDHAGPVASRLTLELTEKDGGIPDSELYDVFDTAHRADTAVVLDDVGEGRYPLDMLSPQLVELCDGIKFSAAYVRKPVGERTAIIRHRQMRQLARAITEAGKTVTLEGVRSYKDIITWRKNGLIFDHIQLSVRSRLEDIYKTSLRLATAPQP